MIALARPEDSLSNLPVRGKVRVATEAFATYSAIRWQMRRGDLRRTVRDIRATGASAPRPDVPDALVIHYGARLGRAVTLTLRPLPTDTRCLMRSLVLLAMLVRRGIDTKLVVGVQPAPGFAAHAWVEREGTPLLPAGEGFEPIVTL